MLGLFSAIVNPYNMTNSIIEIPDSRNVAAAVASNTALCITLCTVVGQRVANATLSLNIW